MAYVKKDWHDLPLTDTPVTADDLDRIENGIEENDKRLNGTKSIQNTIYVNDIKCKNLFNSGIEQGAITGSAFEPNSTRIRTNNFIKVEPGKTYIVSFSSSSALNYDIHYFTTNSFEFLFFYWKKEKMTTTPEQTHEYDASQIRVLE